MSWEALPFLTKDVPARFCEEPRGMFRPSWSGLARPKNEDDLYKLITMANQDRMAIVPYGGGTGLVGGQIYTGEGGAICLTMEKLKTIEIFDDSVLVGAGVVLEELHDALKETEFHFPLSLASSGSAQIGGLISTNAGGINAVRFGTMGNLTLGVRALLGDGRWVDGTNDLRKDNTGYPIDRLLIGSEGSLGAITQARLKIVPKDQESTTLFTEIESPARAYEILQTLKRAPTPLSAFELISKTTWQIREEAGFDATPIGAPAWSIMAELAGDARAFENILPMIKDSVLASNETQRAALWSCRETIPLANRKIGSIASHDIAVKPSLVADFIKTMPAKLARIDDVRINCFGHMGDGNLHYNLFAAKGRTRESYDKLALSEAVYRHVHEMDGSISAEHGIGRLKAGMMRKLGMSEKLDIMRDIKQALDPKGIMNPGVYE